MNHDNIITLNQGLLRISGEQAKKLLQGQLTCNLDDITPTETKLGAHCNPQGRVISLFRISLFQDQYYLQMPRTLIPIAHQALNKYAPFFKVLLHDASDELIQIGYQGAALNNIPTTLIGISTTTSSHELIGKKEDITSFIENNQIETIHTDHWKNLIISAGIPSIYPETSEKFLPHELNLQLLDAISFTKGCYTGQEIIARMQYRGKLKNHMYLAKAQSDTPPKPGDTLYDQTGMSSSTLVDFAQVSYNHYALLVIAAEADVSSRHLYLDAEKKQCLEFLTLPYSL